MKLCFICICVLVVSLVNATDHESSGVYHQTVVTLCPDDYSPRDDCVTLDKLLSADLIKSNTTFKFVSATFKVKPRTVISFQHVSNIILKSAGPQGTIISCVGENSGFIFRGVSELVVQDMHFTGCFLKSGKSIIVDLSSNVLFQNLTIKSVTGGILILNTHGNVTILNSLFTGMHDPGLSFNYYMTNHTSITIANSRFQDNHCHDIYNLAACIMEIFLHPNEYAVNFNINNVTVTNNTRMSSICGIFIRCNSTFHTSILIKGLNYSNNRVVGGFGYYESQEFLYTAEGTSSLPNIITIIDSHFANNSLKGTGQDIDIDPHVLSHNFYGLIFFSIDFTASEHNITIQNTVVANNIGWYGAAIAYLTDGQWQNYLCNLVNSTVANNTIFSTIYYTRGTVLSEWVDIHIQDSSIVNNSVTGLLIEHSRLTIKGVVQVNGNRGYNGGGMALYGDSSIFLENALVIIQDNFAENIGGGLYAQVDEFVDTQCFIVLTDYETGYPNVSLEFRNNTAATAGNDWYGGHLYICDTFLLTPTAATPDEEESITDIIHYPQNYTIDLTSDPLHVCDCTRSNEDCINVVRTIQQVQTYPGKMFNLSLIPVGTVLNTTTLSGVPSPIYAGLLPLNPDPGNVSSASLVHSGQRTCSNFSYRIISTNQKEVMVLTVDDNLDKIPDYFTALWQTNSSLWHDLITQLFRSSLTVPAYIEIELLPCPVGFESPGGECTCSKDLNDYIIDCFIDTMLIKRKLHIWLASKLATNSSTVYMTHRYCPFDYCKPGEVDFSLESPDTQCSDHRSGILCGECKPGYSLTLGKSECRQCTSLYLLLLIPFALAGVLLIVFLSLTDMTVAAGTINGLLFFANIVQENHATFFPPQAAGSFLSVFIAWLNLDFGITSCFYDGLDSYALTWLQFAFPIFIWFLAFSIIVASRYVNIMNKLCGRNIVPVLATLFLLSYTKLQRLITTSSSFTVVDVSDGSKYFVWLEDGNVRYLQGKHIPLFLVSILFLVVLFIPYTLSVMLGPWLQTKTQYRVFCWVLKLKPFFDACFGPLKDKHRYWTGVLLVSRVMLSLISAVNVLGDDSINLVAITILVILLMALLWQSGGVYKSWTFSFLDSFFLANLGILALVTLYIKDSGSSQYATVCVSTGSAFAAFCLIILYHSLKRLRAFALRAKRRPHETGIRNANISDSSESDDELLGVIDRGRTGPRDEEMICIAELENVGHDPDTY